MEKDVLSEILERIVRVETKIDGYNNLREKLDEACSISVRNFDDIKGIKGLLSTTADVASQANNKCCNNEKDVAELADTVKWLSRTIAGAIIILILNIIFK